MTSRPRGDRSAHGLRAMVALLLGLAILAPAATVAQTGEDGSLCDAVDLEAIDALDPLGGMSPELGAPAVCVLADASGSLTLTVTVSGLSYDLMRSSAPGVDELTVAGRPAIIVDDVLHVGLEDGIASIILEVDAGGERDDIDPLATLVDVAEVLVPTLHAGVATDSPDGPPPASLELPEANGIEWGSVRDPRSLADLIAGDEAQAAIWQSLVEASGVEAERIVLHEVTALDPDSGERLGTYSTLRFEGGEGVGLRSVIVEWFRTINGGEDVTTTDLDLGGKDIVELEVGGESRGYLFVAGDTAHAITMPEEAAARLLEALP